MQLPTEPPKTRDEYDGYLINHYIPTHFKDLEIPDELLLQIAETDFEITGIST